MANNKAFKVKNGLELQDYNKTISDTAVDVFVYDTRKDSDGGAWRKRTQHTSWYNETLDTATRGSRKEFPAVAVIVAESNQVTIYDGDDPDLPMWMVFDGTSSTYMMQAQTQTSVTIMNGVLCAGSVSNFHTVSFIEDISYADTNSGRYPFNGNILQRNLSQGFGAADASIAIVNSIINDVAMTVLPNAPIDDATGLPVPTIAVATDGGVSVIKDDGTVVDVTESTGPNSTHAIEFTDDNKIVFMWSDTSGVDNYPHIGVMPIPSSDQSSAYYYTSTFIEEDYSYQSAFANSNEGPVVVPSAANTRDFKALARNKSCGYDSGLAHIYSNPSDARRSMVAYITSSYNTGWMNGDIKLATLSDTDATNVTGSELVTNGDFATSSDWTTGSYWSIGSGVATKSAAGGGTISQVLSLTSGTLYVMSVDVTSYTSGDIQLYVDGVYYNVSDSTGVKTATFNAPDASVVIGVYGNSGSAFSIDNVSVRLAEEDRSVNGNGLQVFGTVTKSAVATGADLVAYSGFDASNYLLQPYNADLDFGTGDFCVMGWFKGTDPYGVFCGTNTVSGNGFQASVTGNAGSSTYLFIVDATSTTSPVSGTIESNTWVHVVFKRKDGVAYIYENASLIKTSANAGNVENGDTLAFGYRQYDNAMNYQGSLALWRISATAPSPEQIKKIYEDEKVLFQEGAQATLYGSSDAVTALAYDDSTNLLHVGTSAGRSVFQGLRRVDNTTTAVGAAISASNGLVAED